MFNSFFRKISILALLVLAAVPALAAPQSYAFEGRKGGALAPGLGFTITSAHNAATDAAVTTGLPTVVDEGDGTYMVHYDPIASGPLLVVVTASSGAGVTDPNEQSFSLHLTADPANVLTAAIQSTTAATQSTSAATSSTANTTAIQANTSAIAALPAATVTAFKADIDWRKMLAYSAGKFTFVPGTGILTLYDRDGSTPITTLTLTKDGAGNTTLRTAQ